MTFQVSPSSKTVRLLALAAVASALMLPSVHAARSTVYIPPVVVNPKPVTSAP